LADSTPFHLFFLFQRLHQTPLVPAEEHCRTTVCCAKISVHHNIAKDYSFCLPDHDRTFCKCIVMCYYYEYISNPVLIFSSTKNLKMRMINMRPRFQTIMGNNLINVSETRDSKFQAKNIFCRKFRQKN